jgi:hypothetical protein
LQDAEIEVAKKRYTQNKQNNNKYEAQRQP